MRSITPTLVIITASGARRILGPREACLPCLQRYSGARIEAFPSPEAARQFCDEAPSSPPAAQASEGDVHTSSEEAAYVPDPQNSVFANLEGPGGKSRVIRVDDALRRFLKTGRYIYKR